MEHRALGASGLKVSTLCLGAMTFGEADEKSFMHKLGSPEAEAHAILDRALAGGIDFVDVADVYGQDGLSERVIGNWFEKTGRRNEVILATKFRFRMWGGPNGTGASRYHIVRACEDSLRRLKTDRIELYQIHMQDLDTPEEETLRALDDLVRAGKVQYIGCSNYAAYRLMDSLWIGKAGGLERFVGAQMQYSLLFRDIEREHVPLCRRHGVGILPWSPLAGGFLTGKFRRDHAVPEGARLTVRDRIKEYGTERNWNIIEELVAVASEVGASASQVAVAWLLRKPAVTSVIIGARTIEQLEDNLPAAELKLPDAAFARLDAASALAVGYPYEFMRNVQKELVEVALPDDFKHAMGSWASGVAVVTTNDAGLLYGITVSSFTSVSLDPPLILVCIGKGNRMPEILRRSQCFAVSVLRADQQDASRYFATPGREPTQGFVTIEGGWSARNQPIVKDSLAHVVCEVHAEHDGGDHFVFFGKVVHAETDPSREPLLYWRRTYRSFAER